MSMSRTQGFRDITEEVLVMIVVLVESFTDKQMFTLNSLQICLSQRIMNCKYIISVNSGRI